MAWLLPLDGETKWQGSNAWLGLFYRKVGQQLNLDIRITGSQRNAAGDRLTLVAAAAWPLLPAAGVLPTLAASATGPRRSHPSIASANHSRARSERSSVEQLGANLQGDGLSLVAAAAWPLLPAAGVLPTLAASATGPRRSHPSIASANHSRVRSERSSVEQLGANLQGDRLTLVAAAASSGSLADAGSVGHGPEAIASVDCLGQPLAGALPICCGCYGL